MHKDGYQYVTPRTLLAIIRLAQGLARLRFNDEVEQIDVDEALRLIEVSRSQINEEEDKEKETYVKRQDTVGSVFLVLREMCNNSKDKTIKISDLLNKCLSKSLSQENVNECLEEYTNLNVIYVNNNRTEVTLI
jgi:DNA replication licensing factor MCM7